MRPTNVLVLMSDQHNPKMLGCRGHDWVKTPNLDALAQRGIQFDYAYSNSPLCVPARAGFATGRYPHETGCWDNAIAYDGSQPSWGHRLQANLGAIDIRAAGGVQIDRAVTDCGNTQGKLTQEGCGNLLISIHGHRIRIGRS